MVRERNVRTGQFARRKNMFLTPKGAALLATVGALGGGVQQAYQFGKKAVSGYNTAKGVYDSTKKVLFGKKPTTTKRTFSRTKSGALAVATVNAVGTNGRRVKKPSKNFARGVQICREQGEVVTADYSQYIGHATCPTHTMQLCFWRAVVKQLFIKAGLLNPNFNEAYRSPNLGVDRIIVTYQVDENSGPIDFNYLTVVGDTQESISLVFYNAFDGFNDQFTINNIHFRPSNGTIGATHVYLKNAKVDVMCDSTFKFQNRTVNFADQTEADEVTNAPLQGRLYEGPGTGTDFLLPLNPTSMYCSNSDGTIKYNGDTVEGLKEPPSAKMFNLVTKTNSIRVGPGEIKVSKLMYSKTIPLRTFVRKIWGDTNNTPRRHNTMGSFKMYGLEKMMQVLPVITEGDNIRIAYEHDLKCSIAISPGYQTYTTTIFTDRGGQAPQ